MSQLNFAPIAFRAITLSTLFLIGCNFENAPDLLEHPPLIEDPAPLVKSPSDLDVSPIHRIAKKPVALSAPIVTPASPPPVLEGPAELPGVIAKPSSLRLSTDPDFQPNQYDGYDPTGGEPTFTKIAQEPKPFTPRPYHGYDPMAPSGKTNPTTEPLLKPLPIAEPASEPLPIQEPLQFPEPGSDPLQLPELDSEPLQLPELGSEPMELPELGSETLQLPEPTSASDSEQVPELEPEVQELPAPAPSLEEIAPLDQEPDTTIQEPSLSDLPDLPQNDQEEICPDPPPMEDPMGLPPDDLQSTASSNLPPQITTEPRPFDASDLPETLRGVSLDEILRHAFNGAQVLRSLGIRVIDNPASAVTVYDPAITVNDPFFGESAALSEFDALLSGSINSQNNDRVFNNATLGGQVQELTQDLVNFNGGWQKRSQNGALWDATVQTIYDNNNRAGNNFRNYWETQFSVGVRQPLLRGAGTEFNRIAGPNAQPGFNFSNGIVIAKLNSKISAVDFQIGVKNFVRDIHTAYWRLQQNYQDLGQIIAARDLAYKTWQATLAKKQSDLIGADKEAQARAKYYRYVRQVQVALGGDSGQGGLYSAERQLRKLAGMAIVDRELLQPTDIANTAEYVVNYDNSLATAIAQRPELKRQTLALQQQRLRMVAAKNFLLPQLDLIGRYRIRGFGDDLAGSGARFDAASEDFFSLDHQEFEFGVEVGTPVGRRQAHAAVRHAKLQVHKEQSILDEQHRDVQLQVSDALAEVNSSFQAYQTSRQQAEASRERLEASKTLFEVDKIEIEFMLEAQEELLGIELQLSSDQIRYVLAMVRLNDATGDLLAESNVIVSTPCCH